MLRTYLDKNLVFINPPVANMEGLFEFFAKKAKEQDYIKDEAAFVEGLLDREEQFSNVVREHFAIPHVRCSNVKRQFAGICVFTKGLDYTGLKGDKAVKVVICVGSRKEEPSFLSLFADIALLLEKCEFRSDLACACVPDDVLLTVSDHSIQEFTKKIKTQTRYKIFLILNKEIDTQILLEVLLETKVRCVSEILTENFYEKHIGKLSILKKHQRGLFKDDGHKTRILVGLTDEKNTATKIYSHLKNQKYDLNEPGVGALYITEILCSYGGIDQDFDLF